MVPTEVYYPHNPLFRGLYTNLGDQENSYGNNYGVDFLSNGFKLRKIIQELHQVVNIYIHGIFAEQPLKYANGF